MKNKLIEIRNGILSALEQNDGILSKMYVNKLDTLIHELSNQQETLEEIRKYAELSYYNGDEVNAFVDGVKYQSKRMYSEEEVLEILCKSHNSQNTSIVANTIIKWFEQFKKTK
jgi:hypothetical protein